MYFSDGIIILLSGIIFGLNKIMYGIILLYIISYITDKVIIGVSESKAFYIITKNPKEIKNILLTIYITVLQSSRQKAVILKNKNMY